MKIAVLPGDGIGPEIVKQAVKVLKFFDLEKSLEYASIGGAGYEKFKDPLPNSTLELALKADAILLGAVGDWKYDKLPRDMRPERGLLRIRQSLNLFANLRPAIMFSELIHASSLKAEVVSDLDILIINNLNDRIVDSEKINIMEKRLKKSKILKFEKTEHEIFMEKDKYRNLTMKEIEQFLNISI